MTSLVAFNALTLGDSKNNHPTQNLSIYLQRFAVGKIQLNLEKNKHTNKTQMWVTAIMLSTARVKL